MENIHLTLVTGATGNLGNAIVRELVSKGRRVRCLVRNMEVAQLALPTSVEFFQGDLTNEMSIQKAMINVNVVYHAGGIPEQWHKDPSVFQRVNTEGTKLMIKAALLNNVEKFIYTSTQDVFDLSADDFDETSTHSRLNCSFYEESKILAQDLIDKAVKEQGLPAVSLHPTAIYGVCKSKPTGLNVVFDKLLRNDIPVILNGGFPVVFNEDAARAHVLAEEKAPVGEKYILTDKYFTLKDMAVEVNNILPESKIPMIMPDPIANLIAFLGELISKITGKAPLVSKSELNGLRRKGRPNGMKIRNELGWKTIGFNEGVKATIESLKLIKSNSK